MWRNIYGHDHLAEYFQTAVARGRLASTFLFVGPTGVGKHTFARQLAQTLLCHQRSVERFVPCDMCESCRLFLAGNHPDLHEVRKPEDKSEIPVALLIGDLTRNMRMKEGFSYEMHLKPYLGNMRVGIIDDADYLNQEGVNSLLKLLEEPPPHTAIILISHDVNQQLPTIRSRAQLIRFRPLSTENLRAALGQTDLAADPAALERALQLANGSVGQALETSHPDFWQFRQRLFASLAKLPLNNVALAREVLEFVEAAGKEARDRRPRLIWAMLQTAEFYRHLARALCGQADTADPTLAAALATAQRQEGWDIEAVLHCAERSLAATEHVERYLNQNILCEAWLEELSVTLSPVGSA
ncbi:MAG: DNA polymerase III subunit [Pirellulales bacterium]|nr:DNA polymerase III subunit [Pirellulales bacterium]